MPKRQTETKIWSTQRWYRKLHPYHKLVWKYLTDCCDHAGIWKIDYGQLVDDTGIEDFNMADFLRACNTDFDKETGERIYRERILNRNGILWITGFIRFQYENKEFQVNPEVAVVRSALDILKGYGILPEALDKGYITLSKPFGKPSQTLFEPTLKQRGQEIDAKIPHEGALASEKPPDNPSQPLPNPSLALTEPFSSPYERGAEGLKYKEHNTLSLGSNRESEEAEEKKSNLEESKSAVVVDLQERDVGQLYNVENYFSAHQAEYESICMKLQKSDDFAKKSLRKYHLHLEENTLYPKTGRALRAGFEKWLMNEKSNAQNGNSETANDGRSAKLGTSTARTEALKNW